MALEIDSERSWAEYRRLIIAELERINDNIIALNAKIDSLHRDELSKIKIDIATLKTQAVMLGVIGGAVTVAAAEALTRLFVH